MTFMHLLTRFCFDDILIDFKTLSKESAKFIFRK